jgi:L-ascorbate metabolism protein UlaG (beta-lactamase superfamily)
MVSSVHFRWLGVAGIELRVNKKILAIDPFFTRPPAWHLCFGRVVPNHELITENMPDCDYVLVTHAHYDHVMDVPDIVRNTGATALGSPNTCQLLAVCGVPQQQIRRIQGGDQFTLGSFRVEVLMAQHIRTPGFLPGPLPPNLQPPLRLRDYRMDRCFSFLIEVGGLRLLDWCGIRSEPAPPADVLFVAPHGASPFFEALFHAVRPRLVVPVHWEDFFRPLSKPVRPYFKPPRWAFPPLERMEPGRFRSLIEGISPEARVLFPEMFSGYDLHRPMQQG